MNYRLTPPSRPASLMLRVWCSPPSDRVAYAGIQAVSPDAGAASRVAGVREDDRVTTSPRLRERYWRWRMDRAGEDSARLSGLPAVNRQWIDWFQEPRAGGLQDAPRPGKVLALIPSLAHDLGVLACQRTIPLRWGTEGGADLKPCRCRCCVTHPAIAKRSRLSANRESRRFPRADPAEPILEIDGVGIIVRSGKWAGNTW